MHHYNTIQRKLAYDGLYDGPLMCTILDVWHVKGSRVAVDVMVNCGILRQQHKLTIRGRPRTPMTVEFIAKGKDTFEQAGPGDYVTLAISRLDLVDVPSGEVFELA